jgi:HlyD family secretion protein
MVKRIVIWLVVLVALGGGGAAAWRYHVQHQPPPYTFQTEPLAKRRIQGKVTATGTLLATVTVQVGTQVSGRVQKLFVDYNSPVKQGQMVAKIDPLLFQSALEQSKANFMQAQAQLISSKAQAELTQKLYARQLALQKDNLAAQQDVDTAQTNASVALATVEVSKANLAQAQAALHTAETNLDYTNIVSPIDGTVISRSVDVGQTVAASLSAPVLFTIAQDLKKMQVNTNISEGDVGRLKEGMTARFTVDAFPGQRFKGVISQIRNAATTLQNVVTYDAVIDVDNSDLRLRPGMTANTTVVYAEEDEVLSVPNTALRFHPPPEISEASPATSSSAEHHHHRRDHDAGPGGGAAPAPSGSAEWHHSERSPDAPKEESRVIWIQVSNMAHPVTVKIGLSDGSYTEVIGDVHEGDPIIVDATSTAKGGGLGGPGGGGGGGQRRGLF